MASTAGIVSYPTFREAYAAATTDEQRSILQWHILDLYEGHAAARSQRNATNSANNTSGDRILVSDYIKQVESEADTKTNITAAQKSYSNASKARARGAKILHQQRKTDLSAEIQAHESAIAAIKGQLAMITTSHQAEHLQFDKLDALDMQLEDERRLPAPAAAHARTERAAKRAANTALATTMAAEITALAASIDGARAASERRLRRATIATARASLRGLRALRAAGASTPKGERKMAFWNAIRRALVAGEGGAPKRAEDVVVYEEYKRELEGPVWLEAGWGMPPAPQVVGEWPELGEEREGMFSVSGWQL
jgi:hypothetical protein